MKSGQLIAIVARDRSEVERTIDAFFSRRSLPEDLAGLLDGLLTLPIGRCFCVQRYPKFLEDHTIVDNWCLPLWEIARQNLDEWNWLQEEARAIMSRYTSLSAKSYPAQLDDVARVAAHFAQAHILMPELLLLDGVFSDWHRSDRERVVRMLCDYCSRYPLRPVLHVDLVPPPDVLPFRVLEMVEATTLETAVAT